MYQISDVTPVVLKSEDIKTEDFKCLPPGISDVPVIKQENLESLGCESFVEPQIKAEPVENSVKIKTEEAKCKYETNPMNSESTAAKGGTGKVKTESADEGDNTSNLVIESVTSLNTDVTTVDHLSMMKEDFLQTPTLVKTEVEEISVKDEFSDTEVINNSLSASYKDLRFNRIRSIEPGAFERLKKLTTLLLNDNHIQGLKDGTFRGLSELKHLYLYKNKIRELAGRSLEGMPRLKQLYLHYNKIERIEPHVFDKLQNLERLFLHENKIQHVHQGTFETLPSLQRLRLDGNALVCDCNLKWFKKMMTENMNHIVVAATCQYPDKQQEKSIMEMEFNDLNCNEPRIIEGPHDVHVDFGGPAKFTCRVDGEPKPSVTWMINSNEIDRSNPKYSIDDDGSLVVNAASEKDFGTYECVAQSPYGTTKSGEAKMLHSFKQTIEIFPNLSPVPQFNRRPIDQVVKEGETVQLECSVTNYPNPIITWTKDDLPLSNSRARVSPEGTLTISDVILEDSALYRCVIQLPDGGSINTPAKLTVNAPPRITSPPENQSVNRGSEVRLQCIAYGDPHPVITWYKDGNSVQPTKTLKLEAENTRLIIKHAEESDAGLYTCLAQSVYGTAESNGEIRVRPVGPRAPVFVSIPHSLVASLGSAIEFPCKAQGEPFPAQEWTKNKEPIAYDSQHKVFPSGSLRLYNVSIEDEGTYECKATNEHGTITVEATLRVKGYNDVDDSLVLRAFDDAQITVDRAVNATIAALFSKNVTKSPGALMAIFRYPDATSRAAVRAADVYENTLLNIRRQISAGAKVDPTDDFKYEDILTPEQIQLVAKLSGCMEHQVANCSDMCFHSKYRTIDGTCNNLQHPYWGASHTGFRRILSPIYENGFSQPVGWNKKKLYNGYPLPPARLVSTSLIRTEDITADSEITHMVMQWGQFLDHDLDHAIPSTTAESWEGLDCKKSCDASPPCFPMEVPHGDDRIKARRCMDFIRSSAICGSGITSVFFNKIMPREQINQLTAFIDGSQVYGFTTNRSILLRDYSTDLGLLRTGIVTLHGKPLLPIAGAQEVDCRRDPTESEIGCFLAGDIRVNEQVSLLAMHTIWLREHNRIAEELKHINPHWTGETIFNEARKIVGAEMQHITYKHWLPVVLGPKGMEMLGKYTGYDPSTDPAIANEFATSAFRFGHTLINPILTRLNETFQTIPEGDLPLGKAFFAPWRVVDEGGIDPLMRGMFMSPAKRKTSRQNLNNQLTEHLFTSFHAVALDLASMNVQRSRDHGIPFYNSYREKCGLRKAETFEDLREEISDPEVIRKLQELYGHPGNIDIFVGGILEDQVDGARFGPTFRCILVEQFKRIRDGDRFWYESPATFTSAQLTQISQSSLARVLCDNGDNITRATPNVFLLPNIQQTGVVSCDEIPGMDLRFWYECPDCGRDSRSRRHSNKDDPMEGRMEALEGMVKKLQKTVNNLRRRMRSMAVNGNCKDDHGKLRSDGESWQANPCTACECQESQVKCTRLQCVPLNCQNQRTEEGKCCPVCA